MRTRVESAPRRPVADGIDGLGAEHVAAVIMEPNAGTNGHRRPGQLLARAAPAHRAARGVADRRRGHERVRPLRRVVRLAAPTAKPVVPDLMTLAKGLTGAALPLGAVVLSAEVAARIEHEMLYTGLTYCGHPLACAAGLAALAAYAEDDLIARSRRLGAELLAQLQRLQGTARGDRRRTRRPRPVCGDRAGRRPRDPARCPRPGRRARRALRALVDAAMAEGVSLATRGNLILLAPPLVIAEDELADALAVIDRLLSRFFPA
jgi:taurine--2-oxoglutarate transaminase